MSAKKLLRVTRRRFLQNTGLMLAAASATPVFTAPFVSRALADNKSLSIVQWSHFVPEYDAWFDKFAKDDFAATVQLAKDANIQPGD